MKTIATINFKGGAGKTTVTWLLVKYLAKKLKKNVLIVDTDPQMSLTLAVQLEEDKGILNEKFGKWFYEHKNNQKTLMNLIENFQKDKSEQFNFSVNNLIYKISDQLHLLPSSLDLYWLDYDIYDRDRIKSFVGCFLNKLANSTSFNYDYVFFDCPPSFNALTYSVLSSASMVLIPVNPDVMAAKSLHLLIEGLVKRLRPAALPKISVFMNRANTYRGSFLTAESKTYLNEVKRVSYNLDHAGISIDVLDSFIPEYTGMKHALSYDNFPDDYEPFFHDLWDSIDKTLNREYNDKVILHY